MLPVLTAPLLLPLIAAGGHYCSSNATADDVLAGIDLRGGVYVSTGGDGHIASELNVALARANATVLLACYDAEACRATEARIRGAVDGARVETGSLDLSSAASIRAFAADVLRRHPGGIAALVNAAGAYSTRVTDDGLVSVMEINLLGHALLTDLMLPALRGYHGRPQKGRVVNVAAAVYGFDAADNASVADLSRWCTTVDPALNATGQYFAASKYLLIHHAVELARREAGVTALALNPGYALEVCLPNGTCLSQKELRELPAAVFAPHTAPSVACVTNELISACPQRYAQAAAVLAAAAAWPEMEAMTGEYLDFSTRQLPPSSPHGPFGPFEQSDPTCVSRPPPPMDADLRAAWYDKMLDLMGSGTVRASGRGEAV